MPTVSAMSWKFLVIFLVLSVSHFGAEADLAEDERKALLSLRDAVGGRIQLWNASESPCSWDGVFCSKSNDTVVALRFPGMGLSGQLPAGLGDLKNLQILSLRFNSLTGTLPEDISKLNGSLRNLYLQGNSFSGSVPSFLFDMKNLIRLNLAKNNFSGKISKDFSKLRRLLTLYLEENRFSGKIPKSDSLSSIARFNVSHNMITGRIPNWANKFSVSSFEGNALCGAPLVACKKKKLSGGAIAGIVIASLVVALLILALLLFLLTRRKRENPGSVAAVEKNVAGVSDTTREAPPEASGKNGNTGELSSVAKTEGKTSAKSLVFFSSVVKKFELEDLLRASAEVLGKGTFGTTYKANIDGGSVVAVKRLKDVAVTEEEFRQKMTSVGNMNHENLVPLRAYYHGREEKLLVYDFMPMGSLSALLHGNRGGGRTPLNWETRSRIAVGAVRGIDYIHSQGPSSSHGNIKSSNILLSKGYESRVSDFGLAQLAVPSPMPNRVDGYRAPELTDTRKVSQKADVYSFGVFLLELLTGKPPTHSLDNEDGVDLPRWVQSVVREEWTAEVFDMELLRYQDVEEEMVQLLQLAVDCTAQYPDSRPSMAEVRTKVEEFCRLTLQSEHQDDGIVDDGPS